MIGAGALVIFLKCVRHWRAISDTLLNKRSFVVIIACLNVFWAPLLMEKGLKHQSQLV